MSSIPFTTSEKHASLRWPLVAAFVVRVAMIPFANIAHPKLWEYGEIARNILAGRGYAFHWPIMEPGVTITSAFVPPGATMVHLFGLGLFGDQLAGYLAIFIVQVLCGVGFVYYSAKIVGRFFPGRRIIHVAAWGAALYPTFVYSTATFGVASEMLFLNALFIFLACGLWDALRQGDTISLAAVKLGIGGGVLILFRSEAPVTIVLTLALLLYESRSHIKRAVTASMIVALVALCIIAPWTIRNAERFHAFIPGSTNGGLNLWIGNNALATGSGWNASGGAIGPTDTLDRMALPHGPISAAFETNLSSMLTAEALHWMKSHPGDLVLLDLKKATMLWLFDWYNPASQNLAYRILSIATLAVAGFGFVRYMRTRNGNATGTHFKVRLLALIVTVNTLVAMIFFVVPRYQILLVGIYWPFVAFGMEGVLIGLRREQPEVSHSRQPAIGELV